VLAALALVVFGAYDSCPDKRHATSGYFFLICWTFHIPIATLLGLRKWLLFENAAILEFRLVSLKFVKDVHGLVTKRFCD